jgi:hypothetical protein
MKVDFIEIHFARDFAGFWRDWVLLLEDVQVVEVPF